MQTVFTIKYQVGEADIEASYKHVHHAHALIFLERARLDLLRQIGFPNEEFFKDQLFFVIVGLKIHYLREIFEGEITVTCEAPRIRRKLVTLEQRILNAEGKPAVEAEVDSMFMSGVSKKAVSPPHDFAKTFLGQG